MVEANRFGGKKKAAPPMKGKKGKVKGKGKGGMSEEEAEAMFMADLAKAIAESKVTAGLVDPLEDYVAGHNGIPDEHEEPHEEEESKEHAAQ